MRLRMYSDALADLADSDDSEIHQVTIGIL
jgi:hypothetical protein